jgi:hypothetical protein
MTRRPKPFGYWVDLHLNKPGDVGRLASWRYDNAQHAVTEFSDVESARDDLVRQGGDLALFDRVVEIWTRENTVGTRVYFVQAGDGGPIKIGLTDDVRARMAQLQTGNPFKLKLLGFFIGSVHDERALHTRFARWRLEGEWFVVTPELLHLIEGRCG